MPLLEVISTSPKDSRTIQSSGADRIQLVSALQIGGLTPSMTIIRKSIQCVDLPTMVMVRHHNNGFIYDEQDKQLMCEQVHSMVEMGVKGIVVGGLNQDKAIDIDFVNKILQQISINKIQITFHKAIDHTKDIIKSYDQLSSLRVTRVLTQGGQQSILQNLDTIKQLVQKSTIEKQSPRVLLGGGITFENVKQIVSQTKCQQVHIGTCVRRNKYGPVDGEKLAEFIKLIKN